MSLKVPWWQSGTTCLQFFGLQCDFLAFNLTVHSSVKSYVNVFREGERVLTLLIWLGTRLSRWRPPTQFPIVGTAAINPDSQHHLNSNAISWFTHRVAYDSKIFIDFCWLCHKLIYITTIQKLKHFSEATPHKMTLKQVVGIGLLPPSSILLPFPVWGKSGAWVQSTLMDDSAHWVKMENKPQMVLDGHSVRFLFCPQQWKPL